MAYIKLHNESCWGPANSPVEVPDIKAERLIARGKAERCEAPVIIPEPPKVVVRRKKKGVDNADSTDA